MPTLFNCECEETRVCHLSGAVRGQALEPSWRFWWRVLGIVSAIMGIIGIGLIDIFGGSDALSESEFFGTAVALERDKNSAEAQLTQIGLLEQQAANQSTQQALEAQEAIIMSTLSAAEAEQAALLATQNEIAGQTATVEAANEIATMQAQDATATANFLAQIAPTATPLPTSTAVPEVVVDHRSITGAAVQLAGAEFSFLVSTSGIIPELPQNGLSYIWSLDTDSDVETGLKVEDIGVDTRVSATFTDGAWAGTVEAVQDDGTVGKSSQLFFDIKVDGSLLQFSLSQGDYGLTRAFNWIASVELGERTYEPSFPVTGHASLSR